MVAGSYSGRNPKDLHHFVAQVADDLDGNPPGGGFGEGAGEWFKVAQASSLISALSVVLRDW